VVKAIKVIKANSTLP